MALLFDKLNRIIIVEAPQTEVTIQTLINEIRNWEDEFEAMDIPSLANAAGKQDLGGGVKVGITLELINNWRIQFEARPGPDYVACRVLGGNLVATNDYDNNPIKPSAYTQITTAQSTSASVVETGVSGLTSEESDRLMNEVALESTSQGIKEKTDPIDWAKVALEETAKSIKAKTDAIKWSDVEFLRHIEGGNWRIKNNQMIFYTDDDSVEIARFNLLDKKGKPAEINVFERKRT